MPPPFQCPKSMHQSNQDDQQLVLSARNSRLNELDVVHYNDQAPIFFEKREKREKKVKRNENLKKQKQESTRINKNQQTTNNKTLTSLVNVRSESLPCIRFLQNVSMSGAPGNFPAIPMTATSTRSPILCCLLRPPRA